jgi:hypothetical protein
MSVAPLIEKGDHGLPAVPGVRYRYDSGGQRNQFETGSRILAPSLWSPECIPQCLNYIDLYLGNHPLANWFRNVTTTMSLSTSAQRKGLPGERKASDVMRNYFMTKIQSIGVDTYVPGDKVVVYESPTPADTTFRMELLVGDGRYGYRIDPDDLAGGCDNAFHIAPLPQDAINVPGLRTVTIPFIAMPVSIDAMDCVMPQRPGGLRDAFSEATQEALRFTLFAHNMNSTLPNAKQQAVQHILRAQRAIDSIPHAIEQNPGYPSPDAIVTTLALAALVQRSIHNKLPNSSELDRLLYASAQTDKKVSATDGKGGNMLKIMRSIFPGPQR